MEEIQFTIGARVEIQMNGIGGEVFEIWMSKEGVKYNVRYSDTSGRINETWFCKDELHQ